MVDIMVARNYEYGDSGILYLFQFLCQLLVVYLLTILGDISAQDQDRRFFIMTSSRKASAITSR